MVNKEFFTIPIAIEISTFYRTFFKMESFDDFINKIKTNEKFKDYAVDYMRKHFHQETRKVITDNTGETWFFVDYKRRENKPYTLKYVESLCNLNRTTFLDNYTDILGNKIEFDSYN